MPLTIPVIPSMPAGYVATVADLNALAAACTFLFTKPLVRVHDGAGGLAIGTTITAIAFSVKDYDTDSMWATGANTRLTVQTPGWYKFRYGVTSAGGHTVITKIKSTSGANNPVGAGVVSTDNWAGYTVTSGNAGTNGSAGCSGIWPFYLYSGDFLNVYAQADVAGNTTDVSVAASFFAMEYVST